MNTPSMMVPKMRCITLGGGESSVSGVSMLL
jgi:hypothetical protein